MATQELGTLAPGIRIIDALQAVVTAGGADLAELQALIASLAEAGGEAGTPAADTDHWAATSGLYLATVESLEDADVQQSDSGVSVSSGSITVDGSLFWREKITLTEDSDFDTVSGLTGKERIVRVLASGGDIAVSATDFDVLENMPSGTVTIIEDAEGYFKMWIDPTNESHIRYEPVESGTGAFGELVPVAGGYVFYKSTSAAVVLPTAEYASTGVSGAVTLDFANGLVQKMTMSGNITDFNPPTAITDVEDTVYGEFIFVQDDTVGTYTVTLDAAIELEGPAFEGGWDGPETGVDVQTTYPFKIGPSGTVIIYDRSVRW